MLRGVKLTDFRNFKTKTIKFTKGTTVILGANASGKTNVLESIHLLSTGKSFKASVEEEMINYDKEISRVYGKSADTKLEVLLTRGKIERGGIVQNTARKRLLVNDVGKRLVDFSGILKTVLFRPRDLDLVTESPTVRRNFLDSVYAQIDYEYRGAQLNYEKGVRRRNKLLLAIRDEGASHSQLYFWDKLLIKHGTYLTEKRAEFIDYLNSSEVIGDQIFQVEYDKSIISEERLNQYTRQEVLAGRTLVGPHRDDFIYFIKKGEPRKSRRLDAYGSRGEQRMGVLWTKLAELAFIEKVSHERPTLMLDDIFSELDHEHRQYVVDVMNKQQTIMTTADPHFVESLTEVDTITLK